MPHGAVAAAAGQGLAWWETTLLFVGVPAALFGLVALIAYRPRRARSSLPFPRLGIPVRTAVEPAGPVEADSTPPWPDITDAAVTPAAGPLP